MARIFMKGTEAIAEAAVRAGCRFFAGYPITPRTRSRSIWRGGCRGGRQLRAGQAGGVHQHGVRRGRHRHPRPDQLSSCGISLMSEGVGFCASARVPIVYVNVCSGRPQHQHHPMRAWDFTRPQSQRQRRLQDAGVLPPPCRRPWTLLTLPLTTPGRIAAPSFTDGVLGTIVRGSGAAAGNAPPRRSEVLKERCRPTGRPSAHDPIRAPPPLMPGALGRF